MKFLYIVVTTIILLVSISFAESDSTTVVSVNKSIVAIDDSINRGEYKNLKMEEISDVEGSPAMLQFFFKSEKLIAAIVVNGHESWSCEYRYYYYHNGMPMKYLQVVEGRPDNLPRRAVIYAENGKIVWSNTNVKVDPLYLPKLFKKIQDVRLKFSTY